jgi:hypothetical protein
MHSLEDTVYDALKNKKEIKTKSSGSHGGCHRNDSLIGFHNLQSEIQKRRQVAVDVLYQDTDHMLAGWFAAIQCYLVEEHLCIEPLYILVL